MVLDTLKLEVVTQTLDSINNPKRYTVLRNLKSNPDSYIAEISKMSNLDSVTTGVILKNFEKNGLVKSQPWRDARHVFYKINQSKVERLLEIVNNEENIFLKAYLLSNSFINRIISVLSDGKKLSLVEIDKLAKISPTNNTGRAHKLLNQLILANLVKKEGLVYSLNGSELVKTIKIFKQL